MSLWMLITSAQVVIVRETTAQRAADLIAGHLGVDPSDNEARQRYARLICHLPHEGGSAVLADVSR